MSDEDKFYFLEDLYMMWTEITAKSKDSGINEKYESISEILKKVALLNQQLITIYNTKSRKILFMTDNFNQVLGMSCTPEEYKKKPIYYWISHGAFNQTWFLMQITMFFNNEVKSTLALNHRIATVDWFFNNLVLNGVNGKKNMAVHGKAMEIDKNGNILVTMSIYKDISQFVRQNAGYWAEVKVNESKFYSFTNETNRFSEGKFFSERELEIIEYLKKGIETKEIAEALFLSPHTIETHRKNILNKTGARNISSLLSILKIANFVA